MNRKNTIGVGILIVALVVALGIALPGIMRARREPGERSWGAQLREITSAQLTFKHRDLNGDGMEQFWRADLAGLYGLKGKDGKLLRLISLSLALADDRPTTDLSKHGKKAPRQGYWYRAIRHRDEETPDPDRFAVCAFPGDYPHPSKYTFIVDERGVTYRKDLGHGRGLDIIPSESELKKWKRWE